MKQFLPISLLLSGLIAVAADSTITFHDSNLDAAIRAFLPPDGPKPGEALTEAQAGSIILISAKDKPVRDLTGIERCKQVATIYLSGTQIADLTPLAKLANLEQLTIAGGKIRDLAPLAGLAKLTYLDLSGNEISDLKPLSNLKALTALYLSQQQDFRHRPPRRFDGAPNGAS